MGRTGSGVEARDSSIRIDLSVGGQRVRGTLTVAGKPLKPTPANLKYAARVAAEIREKMRHGTYRHADYFPATTQASSSRDTIGQALDTWLATLAGRPESTLRGYRFAVDWWKSKIGGKPLPTLLRSDILTALASEPAWSGKTRNNKVSVLRQALGLAMADGALAENPADWIKAFAHQRPDPDPFTGDEREAIIGWMRIHRPAPVVNYFEFQFFTGLRTSEALGLSWEQVDLRSRRVTIVAGLVAGRMTDRTKTSRARTVDLNSRALAALERQAAHSRLAGGRVFTDPRSGKPWHDDQAPRNSHWRPALRALGIRYRDPYHTRHTAATTMLMAGANPAYVAAQLGHSVQVLLTVYARWISGDANAAELAKVEAAITGFPPGTPPASSESG